MGIEYTAVPQSTEGSGAVFDRYNALDAGDDDTTTGDKTRRRVPSYEFAKRALILFNLLMFGLIMGFCVGRQHPAMNAMSSSGGGGEGDEKMETTNGLLPPSAFVPDSEYNRDALVVVSQGRLTCANNQYQ